MLKTFGLEKNKSYWSNSKLDVVAIYIANDATF
jgi:hypothetical protein